MKNIRYSALQLENIPRFVAAYKDFYIADAKADMSDIHQQNLLRFVIDNYTNPEFLFLIACSGKKIAGFAVVMPVATLDGIKTVIIEPLWVVPE